MRKTAIIIFALVMSTCSKSPGKLEEIISTGQLQVITRNSPTTYYRGSDGYEGPEYHLVQGFAEHLSAKYNRAIEPQFVEADRFADLFSYIENHQAHIAAAGIAVSEEQKKRVQFGPSYQEVKQHLIYRLNSGRPRTIAQLRGKRLEIRSGSSFSETLAGLQNEHPDFTWSENPNADVAELLTAVDSREIDYTVADESSFELHRRYMPDLSIAMDLKDSNHLAWAFSKDGSDSLLREADEYFAAIMRDGRLEQIIERYYGHTDRFDYVGTRTFIRHHDKRLRAFKPQFRAAGAETGIDWRLLAAIGYQESHWDPAAVSPTGVRGLMMLTQNTARYMGVSDRQNPDESIQAGARYFAKLRERLDDIPEPDRTWFALAAYNVGYSHVRDAQRIVRMQGSDPERWVNLEDALLLLSQHKWYSQVPYGYARGWEPVQYVENVRTYFEILNWLTVDEEPVAEPQQQLAPTEPELHTASAGESVNL